MREEIEVIVSESLPWMDRNSAPPGHREIDRIVAVVEYNPRGNHPKRVKAATAAVEEWVVKNGGQLRSLNPTKNAGDVPGFLAIVEGFKPLPRQRPVSRVGVHAPKNPLVKPR